MRLAQAWACRALSTGHSGRRSTVSSHRHPRMPSAAAPALPFPHKPGTSRPARGPAATNAFTSCLILVNAAAPEGSLGKVNGVGQSIASLVRAAGPALGGLAWAWSLQLAALPAWPAWLPHQYLPFVLVALLAMGTDLVYRSFRLPGEGQEVGAGGGSKGGGHGNG